jgi:hypothetical protein
MASWVVLAFAWLLTKSIKSKPAAANPFVVAKPTPEFAPVMSAIFLFILLEQLIRLKVHNFTFQFHPFN